MTFTCTSYQVEDDGIHVQFHCPDPGAGRESAYVVLVTDTELATVLTQSELRTLIQRKLNRKIKAAGIAAKLDPFIGQSLTVT